MRDGTNAERFTVSDMTVSGVVEEPAKFVQPVIGSHLNERTWALVVAVYAQASRMSPLWERTAAGNPASPEESNMVGTPNENPVILFWESR
jgi:hypothetical protein